jgi:hypothetical protein
MTMGRVSDAAWLSLLYVGDRYVRHGMRPDDPTLGDDESMLAAEAFEPGFLVHGQPFTSALLIHLAQPTFEPPDLAVKVRPRATKAIVQHFPRLARIASNSSNVW